MVKQADRTVIKATRAIQLQFAPYILEARKPTLAELCSEIPPSFVPHPKKRKLQKNKIPQYPPNWRKLAKEFKERSNYVCEACGLQCLKPEDKREHLSRSQIARLRMNCHHIDGNRWNNKNNVVNLCSSCHLLTHRGRNNPPRGQLKLFER